jgi:hypothetical protein
MTMADNTGKKSSASGLSVKRMALVTLNAGCLTFLVAGAALGIGFLLDTRIGSFPRWTLILLAGSAPFTLGGVYLIVRQTLQRMKSER